MSTPSIDLMLHAIISDRWSIAFIGSTHWPTRLPLRTATELAFCDSWNACRWLSMAVNAQRVPVRTLG